MNRHPQFDAPSPPEGGPLAGIAHRAAAIGFHLGGLAGSGYFDPASGQCEVLDACVAWIKAVEGQYAGLEKAPNPVPALKRLERLLDRLPARLQCCSGQLSVVRCQLQDQEQEQNP